MPCDEISEIGTSFDKRFSFSIYLYLNLKKTITVGLCLFNSSFLDFHQYGVRYFYLLRSGGWVDSIFFYKTGTHTAMSES